VAALIAAQRDEHGIPAALACRALGVSRSWFYKHEDGALPPQAVRHEQLKAEVRRLFAAHGGKYGSPRITADLRDEGWAVSKNTVAAVMRELGLAARRKKKRKATTRPGKGRWRAPDLVRRDFPAREIIFKKYGDGTEIGTDEGKLHLASVLDVASRRVLGFALGEHHDAELVYGALAMAVAVRGGSVPGVIFHTDQGSEGGFNWSSQHLDRGGVGWVSGSGSGRFSCIGVRSPRRGGRRWPGGRIGSGFGRRSLAVPRPRTRPPWRACLGRWRSGGSATLAA